jgi:hypothetical protein
MEANKNILDKFQNFINDKNFYQLLLSIKTELRKLTRKGNTKDYFDLLTSVLKVLKENEEKESCVSLFLFGLEEYSKMTFNKADTDLLLGALRLSFENLPEIQEKKEVKMKLMKFFDSKQIPDIQVQKFGFYKLFADDALKNKDRADGYRYALKCEDLVTLNEYAEYFINEKLKNEEEKKYFLARTCLELILLKNPLLAFKFISKYVDASNNFQNNHPILNFAFFLNSLILKDSNDFEGFCGLLNVYKQILEIEGSLVKYLNKISLGYYNKPILKDTGFNIMNLLKAFG